MCHDLRVFDQGEPLEVSDVGVARAYWRWRSREPHRPPPYTIYTFVAVGTLVDDRWYAERQDVDQRAMAYPTEDAALECAHRWMLGADWVTIYTPLGRYQTG